MGKYLRTHPTFLAALILCLAASASAGFAYSRILDQGAVGRLFDQGLSLGTHRFAITANRRCVGSVEMTLRQEDEKYFFQAGGTLRAQYGERAFTSTFTADLVTNSLLQIGIFAFEVTVENVHLLLGFEKTNPIDVLVRVTNNGKKDFERKFQMPGPVLLEKMDGDIYTISYPHHAALALRDIPVPLSFLAAYDLRLQREEAGQPPCTHEEALDLTAAAHLLRAAAPQFLGGNSLVPQGGS